MTDHKMLKMSLLSSLTGIALLYAGAVQMRPNVTPVSEINKDFVGLKTKISGQVINIREHSNGHLFLKIKDESGGTISVPIFEKIRTNLKEKIELLDHIQMTGRVKNYQGELELIPEKSKNIQIIHTAPVNINEINRGKIGKKVKVKGTISKKTVLSGGSLLLKLYKNNSSLDVFIPRSVTNYKNIPDLHKGESVQIGGQIQLYENELELKVNTSYNIEKIGVS